jgi:hypothetical protein
MEEAMPKPFRSMNLAQFRLALAQFPFTRTINAVHLHHCYRPNHAQYRGEDSINSMYEYHTRERGFIDIAQHITIGPDGRIWTGRSWNKAPASASGFNGNASLGPFMIEMVGDFDVGKDVFEDPQRDVTLRVIAAIQQRFGLPPDALKFHHHMSSKSCPGSAIDYHQIVGAVAALHGSSGAGRSSAGTDTEQPFGPWYSEDSLSADDRSSVHKIIAALSSDATPAEPLANAELPESDDETVFTGSGRITSAAARGTAVTAEDLVALRAHVVNLEAGMLTDGGIYSTAAGDVERIFREDMERAYTNPQAMGMPAREAKDPFQVMVWAHGGLISEKDGLAIARKHLNFWKKNGIYPIYVVWETGLFETLGELLRDLLPSGRAARNLFSDNISDPLIERFARLAGGEKIWSGMKRNAELGATPQGGATKLAQELQSFVRRHANDTKVHCSGHSAGSIFHAHFLPVAFSEGLPQVESLHLLAPAIRVDAFKSRLMKLVGDKIKHLSLYTMVKEKELDDHCAHAYRKSLLYLIHHSLEKDRRAEILGLEESLRRDRAVSELLGLGGKISRMGDVVFSPSLSEDGTFASRSTSHGGFDDDAPTMNSVAMRLLGLQTKNELKAPYPEMGGRSAVADPWTSSEIEELRRSFASAVRPGGGSSEFGHATGIGHASGSGDDDAGPAQGSATWTSASAWPTNSPAGTASGASGRQRALCVGIDRYNERPLAGCVADARLWARTLGGLGFQCDLLLDGEATYSAILARLQRLVEAAQPGDVIVWQYAGHGTQVPDVNGDEARGDSPGQDEAICPIDMNTGRLLIDDEIAALIAQLRSGVAFTMLIDCCHSGTLNRFGMGEPSRNGRSLDSRPRFVPLSPEAREAYLRFAESKEANRSSTRSRTRENLQQTSEVLFTACRSGEVAWESNGQGEFTLRATHLLAERGGAFTNEEYFDAVLRSFGNSRRQTPTLACADSLRGRRLFQPFESPARGRAYSDGPAAKGGNGRLARIADELSAAACELRGLR